MFELPLFPLNTVLFPGMPLHLHIFEERYKQMMSSVLETNQIFGVVLIRKGAEALGPLAEPHPIGCTARVVHTHPLGEGRMNVVAVGQERFRTLRLDAASRPFLVGQVELYPLLSYDKQAAESASEDLRAYVERYIQIMVESGDLNAPEPNIPGDMASLLQLACMLLQIPPLQSQRLLEAESTDWLVGVLPGIYRRELALLRAITHGRAEMMGVFSKS